MRWGIKHWYATHLCLVKHWYAAKPGEAGSVNGEIKKEVFISPIVRFCTTYMGGVDNFDQYNKVGNEVT